ncbi:umecyanin-like [Argentina anserina]|uniref:umecyanin-like n=1 Tax=Argentina anserina TaxID=57926 RepID=UPI002176206F|nr:umecyanin-like [Potentilla anserina]
MKTMNVIVVVLAVAVVLSHGAEAVLYTVGDDLGWAIPPGGAATYAAWAAEHSFVVDDELEFDFLEGEQDLAWVTKEDFDSCYTADPLYVYQEPTTLQFLVSDTYYFTSTLAGHCTKGQKIAIYIGALPPSPSPIPSPSPCPYASSADEPQSTKFVSHKILSRGN